MTLQAANLPAKANTELYHLITKAIFVEPEALLSTLEEQEPDKPELEAMVKFLDDIVAWKMEKLDKYDYRQKIPEPRQASKIYDNTDNERLVNIVFFLRNHFNLSDDVSASSCFIQKMLAYFKVERMLGRKFARSDAYFVQKLSHLMRNDERVQFGILKNLSKKNIDCALLLALYLDIDKETWPPSMKKDIKEDQIQEQQQNVNQLNFNLQEEYNSYHKGFMLSDTHRVLLINNLKKVQRNVYSFLDNNSEFGLDTKWDASYNGKVEFPCLIQLSSLDETMLIDVSLLWASKKFGKDDWIELFEKIFAKKNTIIGFGLNDILQSLLHSFPFISDAAFMKLKNLICLRDIQSKISGNQELNDKIYKDKKPKSNCWNALSERLINYVVEPLDPLAVWSERHIQLEQLKLAASTSSVMLPIYKALSKRVNKKASEEIKNLLAPFRWPTKKKDAISFDKLAKKVNVISSKGPSNSVPSAINATKKKRAMCIEYTDSELYQHVASIILNEPERLLATLENDNLKLEQLEKIIEFLDDISAWHMEAYDKYDFRPLIPEPKAAQSIYEKLTDRKLLNTIFSIRTRFNLDMEWVINAIFVRKMFNVLKAVRDTNHESGLVDLFFVQKICYLMGDDPRMRFATLKYLSKKNIPQAVFFALFVGVEREDWPYGMQMLATEEDIFEQKLKVDKIKSDLQDSYEKYNKKFNLCEDHDVYLIDSPKKVLKKLYPFLASTDFFGLDAEWDMSFSGDLGSPCLIQISSLHKTMLIDIVALNKHQFGEVEWTDLFRKLFAKKNTIYGFALYGDLQILLHGFPYLTETDVMQFQNLVCLREVGDRIELDNELADKIYKADKPERNNLAGLAKHFFEFDMPKGEQLAVWSERPFRRDQLKYAAWDSYMTFSIGEKLMEKVKKNAPESFDTLFASINWPSERQAAMDAELIDGLAKAHNLINPAGTQNRKTKAHQFTYEDLVTLVNHHNEYLAKRPEIKPVGIDQVSYITDTMCAQLGDLLRRCGVNVIAGNNPAEIVEKAKNCRELKILTTGKAVSKFPFGNRVIDIPASTSTLDGQFLRFLQKEQLKIEMD